jgi:hypothetical protein
VEKDLNYWKKNAEEDYMKVPISVLRYITELEKVVLPQADVSKSFYCLGDSWSEIGNGKCEKQRDDCRAKILKQ